MLNIFKNNRMRCLALVLTLCVAFQSTLKAQGCSDNGICLLTEENHIDTHDVMVAYSASFGVGEWQTYYEQFNLDLSIKLKPQWVLRANGGVQLAHGSLGENLGLTNFTISTSYEWMSDSGLWSSPYIAMAMPMTDGNAKLIKRPLPAAYQSSQGTFDFSLGWRFRKSKASWYFAAMVPLGKSENQFDPALWGDQEFVDSFVVAPNLKRHTSLAFGLAINATTPRVTLRPQLQAIYRLQNSEIVVDGSDNIIVEGTDGLTLNLGFEIEKTMKNNSKFTWGVFAPVLSRDIFADGSQRYFVMQLALQKSF